MISWGLVNLPALLLAPAALASFWEFNAGRTGDLGSIWYVLSLADRPVPNLNLVSFGLFALGCLGIAVLIIVAPRRPRFGAMAFLVMAAFLLTNKVYSPQYMLWLLPFVILARPRWRDWMIFTAGELIYWVAIWWHLGGLLAPGDSSADRIYWLAVLTRLATQIWIVVLVVRDALRPEHDPVRRGRGGRSRPAACWTVPPMRPGGHGVRRSAPPAPSSRPNPLDDSRLRATCQRRPSLWRRPTLTSRSDGRIVIQAWIASRGLIALVALSSPCSRAGGSGHGRPTGTSSTSAELAAGGYLAGPDGTLMAFFPGLPVLLWLGLQLGIPVAVTGVIISLIGSAVAAAALLRLGGPWAAVAWLFAPTAVFTTVPYTESLFCAAAFWAWERARADRWLRRRDPDRARLHPAGLRAVPDRRAAGDDHHQPDRPSDQDQAAAPGC